MVDEDFAPELCLSPFCAYACLLDNRAGGFNQTSSI
jgi:hypothetical protein